MCIFMTGNRAQLGTDMDPNAALRDIIEAVAQGDRDALLEHLEALYDWLRNGGFMPVPYVAPSP
jgi:hypothetical protein